MLSGPVSTHEWGKYIVLAPPGPIAEFGCYEGGSTRILAGYERAVYAYDTFDGIPVEDYCRSYDAENPPGKFKPSESAARMFADYPHITPVVGRYIDTLTPDSPLRFAFAYIDCDLYASYKQVLAWLPQRMLGDVFLCDDYLACEGAAMAVDEWKSAQTAWDFDGRSVFTRR